jgi:hypothetical protein
LLIDPCSSNPGVTLHWVVRNNYSASVTFVWWMLGGTASGGPIVAPANSTIDFDTPVDGPLPNNMAIMWVDPLNGQVKTVSMLNTGQACNGLQSSPTPTPTVTPQFLIPVTGAQLSSTLKNNMFLNLGMGLFGFSLIVLGLRYQWKEERDRKTIINRSKEFLS